MASETERRKILEMVESGKLSAGEGLRLLDVLAETNDDDDINLPESTQNKLPSQPTISQPAIYASRLFWQIPLWLGVTLVVLGAIAMFQALHNLGLGGWFILACLPFLTGVLLIVFAWQSRSARWFRLYIRQKTGKWPRVISFGLPLPLHLITWFLSTFGDKIPSIQKNSVNQLIRALDSETSRDNPIYIDINNEDSNEQVQLFIG
jgi:hypothetical protein